MISASINPNSACRMALIWMLDFPAVIEDGFMVIAGHSGGITSERNGNPFGII